MSTTNITPGSILAAMDGIISQINGLTGPFVRKLADLQKSAEREADQLVAAESVESMLIAAGCCEREMRRLVEFRQQLHVTRLAIHAVAALKQAKAETDAEADA